jgi:hypothetical protein
MKIEEFLTFNSKLSAFYPKFGLNGSILKYSGDRELASPGAGGGVDSSCNDISLSSSIRSIVGVM